MYMILLAIQPMLIQAYRCVLCVTSVHVVTDSKFEPQSPRTMKQGKVKNTANTIMSSVHETSVLSSLFC